jgi:hypothetical protein
MFKNWLLVGIMVVIQGTRGARGAPSFRDRQDASDFQPIQSIQVLADQKEIVQHS